MPYYCPDWLCVGKLEDGNGENSCNGDCSRCTEPLDCSCIKCVLYDTCYSKD